MKAKAKSKSTKKSEESSVPAHLERMEIEQAELTSRIEALTSVVGDSNFLATDLKREHKLFLMRRQLQHMINYSAALAERIRYEHVYGLSNSAR